MAKDPAFLFYTGDFSTGTQFFSDEQVGKYLRLLMAQHQHGHLSEKQMMQICKSHDSEIWSKFLIDNDGKFYQQRLDLEIFKRKNFTESRSKNKLGKTKKPKNTSKSHDLHMEDRDKDENRDTNKKTNTIIYPFNSPEFLSQWENWKQYKSDQHKFKYKGNLAEQGALKKLSTLSDGIEEIAIKIIHESISNGWKGFFKLQNNGQSTTTETLAEKRLRISLEDFNKRNGTNTSQSS